MTRVPLNSRRVLVTGAGGQLGRALLDAVRSRGAEALAYSHRDLAVEDAAAVATAIAAARPDLVVNCAAWTDVDGCESDPARAAAINGAGAAHLAAACRESRARLVQISTDYVFGDGPFGSGARRPIREDDPVGPRSVYGASKLSGERGVLVDPAAGWYVVRTAWVFGPGGRNFPSAILARARRGEPLRVVDDQIGCPTFTVDLAEVILDLVVSGAASGVYHATNSGQCSWHEFAVAVVAAAGLDVPVATMSSAELGRPASRPAWSVLDGSKLAATIARRQPTWQDALRRYLLVEHQESAP